MFIEFRAWLRYLWGCLLASGAGSTPGDPDNPINTSESQGYGAFAFEKMSSPLVQNLQPSVKKVMLFAKSLIPGIAVVLGGGGLEDPSRVGGHTKYPKEIVDVVLGGRAAIRIPGTGTGMILLQGTDNDDNTLVSRRLNGPVPIAVARLGH